MTQTDIFISKLLGWRDAQKAENSFEAWDFEGRYDPEKYRGVATIEVGQNILFRRQCDALRLFGYTGGNLKRVSGCFLISMMLTSPWTIAENH